VSIIIIRMIFFIVFIYRMKKMTKPQLIVELKKQGIGGYSRLKRDEMEELLNTEVSRQRRAAAAILPMAPAPDKPTAAARLPMAPPPDISQINEMEFILGNMTLEDYTCAKGKNTNLALGQQTVECGENKPRRRGKGTKPYPSYYEQNRPRFSGAGVVASGAITTL
jgi:hypothetical protein